MHGHLLGAAGAIEAIATVLALREQVIPPTANLQDNLDPACAGSIMSPPAASKRCARVNSFAFGGSNGSRFPRRRPVNPSEVSSCRKLPLKPCCRKSPN